MRFKPVVVADADREGHVCAGTPAVIRDAQLNASGLDGAGRLGSGGDLPARC